MPFLNFSDNFLKILISFFKAVDEFEIANNEMLNFEVQFTRKVKHGVLWFAGLLQNLVKCVDVTANFRPYRYFFMKTFTLWESNYKCFQYQSMNTS